MWNMKKGVNRTNGYLQSTKENALFLCFYKQQQKKQQKTKQNKPHHHQQQQQQRQIESEYKKIYINGCHWTFPLEVI